VRRVGFASHRVARSTSTSSSMGAPTAARSGPKSSESNNLSGVSSAVLSNFVSCHPHFHVGPGAVLVAVFQQARRSGSTRS